MTRSHGAVGDTVATQWETQWEDKVGDKVGNEVGDKARSMP